LQVARLMVTCNIRDGKLTNNIKSASDFFFVDSKMQKIICFNVKHYAIKQDEKNYLCVHVGNENFSRLLQVNVERGAGFIFSRSAIHLNSMMQFCCYCKWITLVLRIRN
jgi:hypothetical protein